jgi:nitroreductase
MQFDDVILGRRSIRGYKPDPVPRALIEEIIGLAIRAPSSMNTQPWNFYIITGEPLNRIRAGNTERMVAAREEFGAFRGLVAGPAAEEEKGFFHFKTRAGTEKRMARICTDSWLSWRDAPGAGGEAIELGWFEKVGGALCPN